MRFVRLLSPRQSSSPRLTVDARATRGRRAIRGAGIAVVIGGVACGASSRAPDAAPISLRFVAPESVLSDSNAARLQVFDASEVTCTGANLSASAPSDPVLDLHLTRCTDGVRWCGTASLPEDATKMLTWYVSGTYASGQPAFTGCTAAAVAQDPTQVAIDVVAVIPGSTCGDGIVTPPETCDPGKSGTSDEACDATTCQTKEVIVSNGLATNDFFLGNAPGRKTGVAISFFPDGNVFESWSDAATGPSGGDSFPQITLRRLASSLVTDTSGATVLRSELRMQINEGFSAKGDPLRAGACTSASLVPLSGSQMLAAFAWTQPGEKSRIFLSTQYENMDTAPSADAQLIASTPTGSSQDQPATALGSDGGIAIAFIQDGAAVVVVRSATGTIGAPQTLSTAGTTNTRPRIAARPGGYVVVWSDGKDVQSMLLGLDGTPAGAQTTVNANHAGVCDQPDVAVASNGTMLVAYRDSAGDVGADIRVQKLDSTGALTGTEAQAVVNDLVKTGDQSAPAVATGTDGYGNPFFIVVWVDPSRPQIAGRVVAAASDGYENNAVDGSTDEFAIGVGARLRSSPAVAVGGSPAACAVSWVDEATGDPGSDDNRVRVRRIPVPPKLD